MVVEFTNTCAISAYHHKRCKFESREWRGVIITSQISNIYISFILDLLLRSSTFADCLSHLLVHRHIVQTLSVSTNYVQCKTVQAIITA
jgi:hypothetical protein